MGFSQGVSGLKAAASGLDTIGNNISNGRTVGFKGARTEFADIYAGARVGLGVATSGVSQDFSSGALETTGRNLDLAIDGSGFFRLEDGQQTLFSRNGQFQQTKDGTLVNAQGAALTGYNATGFNQDGLSPQINTSGLPETIRLPAEGLAARATTDAGVRVNLDAGDAAVTGAFDSGNDASYNWSTPSTVYDSLGNAHNVNMYFAKTGENQWRVNGEMPLGASSSLPSQITADAEFPAGFDPATTGNGRQQFTIGEGANARTYTAQVTGAIADGAGFTGGTIRYTQQLPETTLSFDANGRLTQAALAGVDKPEGQPAGAVNFGLNAQNGSAPIDFRFDFGGSRQTAQAYSAGSPFQDGHAAGDLANIEITDSGAIRGSYTNGQTVDLARIALAGFANEQGLNPVGGNAWTATAESGQPAIGASGLGGLGDIRGGTLESSNVDMSEQLVDMIIMQRAYQANAQTIKTQDDVLQTAVNLR